MGLFSFKPNVEKMVKKGNVEGLIEALRYKDKQVRRDAAEALGRIGDKRAVEPLINALKYWSWGIQNEAAEALGKIRDARAVDPLIQALRASDPYGGYHPNDPYVQHSAIRALVKIGETAIESLSNGLLDENVRKGAGKALEEILDLKILVEALKYSGLVLLQGVTISVLRELNNEGYHRAIVFAVISLGRSGNARVIELVIQALEDKDLTVRLNATIALGYIRDAKAARPLIETLNDVHADVRAIAAWALGEIGDGRAVEMLAKALNDKEANVRKSAAEALGRIGKCR